MARSSKTGGKANAAPRRKARPVKGTGNPAKTRRAARPAIRSKRSRAADKELTEAREQQAATAEILKIIASSPADVQPVFEAIAESARRLLASHTAVVTRVIGDVVHLAASTADNEAAA